MGFSDSALPDVFDCPSSQPAFAITLQPMAKSTQNFHDVRKGFIAVVVDDFEKPYRLQVLPTHCTIHAGRFRGSGMSPAVSGQRIFTD